MKFGVCIPNYGVTTSVETLRTVTLEAERFGYDSVWTTDHILMPPQSGTPYERIFESITSLAYLAPLTMTVKLGISSLILTMRNPVVVAKQLASIDHFSGGRVMLAIGAGWNEREFAHVGSNFHNRGKRLDESIKLLRALWTEASNAKFEGKTIPQKFSNSSFEPTPIQKKLKIWIAGNSPSAMRRAVSLGDAWHPNVTPLDHFRRIVSEFRTIPEAKGKEICVRIALNPKAPKLEFKSGLGERRLILAGNVSENRKIISELEDLGVTYMVVTPSPDGKVPIGEQVENLRTFAEAFVRKTTYVA